MYNYYKGRDITMLRMQWDLQSTFMKSFDAAGGSRRASGIASFSLSSNGEAGGLAPPSLAEGCQLRIMRG